MNRKIVLSIVGCKILSVIFFCLFVFSGLYSRFLSPKNFMFPSMGNQFPAPFEAHVFMALCVVSMVASILLWDKAKEQRSKLKNNP
jgi:magnesium-transporting ATPase (P-type)